MENIYVNKFMNNQILGIDKEQYNQKASSHSKANILLWILGGIIFNIFKGNLISLSTILLIIPGIFVASFASILTFFVDIKKNQIIPNTNNILVLFLFTIWYVIDLAFPIILSISYVLLIEYLF